MENREINVTEQIHELYLETQALRELKEIADCLADFSGGISALKFDCRIMDFNYYIGIKLEAKFNKLILVLEKEASIQKTERSLLKTHHSENTGNGNCHPLNHPQP